MQSTPTKYLQNKYPKQGTPENYTCFTQRKHPKQIAHITQWVPQTRCIPYNVPKAMLPRQKCTPNKNYTPFMFLFCIILSYYMLLINQLFLLVTETSYLNISDAAKLGDLETLKAAFVKGTPIDQRDKYYKTPLMAACAHGNLDMAKFLLDLG